MNMLILIIVLCLVDFGKQENIVRETQYGKIRGSIRTSRGNSTMEFFYFTGVPYARPPIGDLRFQEPQPPTPWSGIRDVTKPANICVQITKEFMGNEVIGDEDCLFLEISEPITARKTCNKKKLPVMVWIHGGSFIFSSYQETGPDYFMEEPVVLVSIQYRLNVFGFLSTMDDNAKGNLGLKDQTQALVWIKHNIANFGGDPSKVTLFGGSAGGASVQFHMLSAKSRGLFHRAISQSGITFGTWVFQRNPKEMVRRLAKGLGIETTSPKVLVKHLKTVRPDVLVKTGFNQTIMGHYILFDEVPFIPIIEHESETAFLTQRVYKLIEDRKIVTVPYMVGYTTEEGSFPYSYIDAGYIDINMYERNPSLFLPISMNISEGSPCINYSINEVRQSYFNRGSFTDKVNWIQFMGQDIRGIRKCVELICDKYQNYPIFFYVFSYVGTNSLSYNGGAGHYSEVLKLFYPTKPDWDTSLTPRDRLVQKRLLKLWTNFADTGHPTPHSEPVLQNVQWPKYCSNKSYLEIGDELTVKSNPDQEMYAFWENLFNWCGFPPYNTY